MPVSRSLIASAVLFLAGFLTLAGCGGGSNPSGGNNGGGGSSTPAPQTALSASSLDFSTISVGQTSASQSVTVTNTGTITLSILSAPASSDTTDYQMTSTCGASLAASANCTITVTFKPQSAASLPATITFTDNSGNVNTTHTISLSGTGGAAPLTSLSATSLSFGSVPVGQTSATQTVTVTNTGAAALTIASLTLADTTNYTMTTTCGTSVAANGSCTITVAFKPQSAASLPSTITLTDNSGSVSGTTHTIALSGTGTSVSGPVAVLSANSVTFSKTNIGATSAAQTVTLTNTGGSALTINSITLGGTNATSFAETNNCQASLAYNASCTITLTFSPATASNFTATVTIADNAANSPQTITLSGTGFDSSAISYALYELPDPGSGYGSGGMAKLYSLINSTTTSIDMTMYELEDTTFVNDLVTACQRGVKVRVILDQGHKGATQNGPAYSSLNGAGANCSAVYSNAAFKNTHEKSAIFDGTTLALMSLNLQSQYYTTTRDYAMIYNDSQDIAAVEATFNMDYAAGNGGTSDFGYSPAPGSGDLIWSPTTALTDMTNIIANATTSLRIENEEFSSPEIISAVAAACQRGVQVEITIENEDSDYSSGLTTIKNAGCAPHEYTSSTGFYVHAKAVVADYGLPTQNAYVGSINYTDTSMTQNRELGMYVTDTAAVQLLYTTIGADYAGAKAF